MLNNTCTELVFIESLYRHEKRINALKKAYCVKVILLLESEIDLLELTFFQTKQFVYENVNSSKSNVYFISNLKGLRIDNMGEFATAFELYGQFIDEEDSPIPFIYIADALGYAFNFTFENVYKFKARVFTCKPYNLTKRWIT